MACVAVDGPCAGLLTYAKTLLPHLLLGTHHGSGVLGFQGRVQKLGGPNEEIVHLLRRMWFCSACWDLA